MSDFEAAPAPASAKPKITLHWLNQSRSQRIVWLLEELGVEYDIKTYLRLPSMLAPEEVKTIHPLGKLPIVVVDGKVLAESGLITEYLVDKFGPQLKPKDEDSLLLYKYYLHYAEGSLMPPLLVGFIVENMNKAPVPFFVKPLLRMVTGGVESRFLKPSYKTHLDFLESELASRPYLAGEEFSGADILTYFQLAVAQKLTGLSHETYPKVWDYMKKCEARDAFKRATEKTEVVEASGAKLWG
jgi:glutathione S-transferase